jgi:hypothetical protein
VDMRVSEQWSAYEPPEKDGPRIVTVCRDLNDAAPIASSLAKLNTGSLLTYSRQAELRLNPPVGEVALFVLFDVEFTEPTDDTLRWLGRYWPGTAMVVVGGTGAGRQELQARMGGAIYLVYQTYGVQTLSLVQLAVERTNRTDSPAV